MAHPDSQARDVACGKTAVHLRLAAASAIITAPHLGQFHVPARLAEQCALIADLQREGADTSRAQALTLPASEQQVCAWLAFNAALLPVQDAERAAALATAEFEYVAGSASEQQPGWRLRQATRAQLARAAVATGVRTFIECVAGSDHSDTSMHCASLLGT